MMVRIGRPLAMAPKTKRRPSKSENEAASLEVPGPGRLDELEAFEMGVDGGGDDVALDFSRLGVGQKEIDGEKVPGR